MMTLRRSSSEDVVDFLNEHFDESLSNEHFDESLFDFFDW
jgi:hypothetical protein